MDINWSLIIRILIAGLLGGLIGLERTMRAKEAGVRTHFVVAIGSALFMIISQFAFEGQFDRSRVAAQVVSGIGFIGAGVIIFQKNMVRGVTTAAGLWVAAAIGLACGAAMYDVATAVALMTIICLETMHFINKNNESKTIVVSLKVKDEDATSLMEGIKKKGLDIESLSIEEGKSTVHIRSRQKDYLKDIESLYSLAGKEAINHVQVS